MAFYNRKSDTSNFVVSWTGDPRNDFGLFAKGYIYAAERLAADLLGAPRFSDYAAYPVIFLYRHALELSLKHIIYRCTTLGSLRYIDEIDKKLHNNHRLQELMAAAAASLELVFPGDEFLAAVIRKCNQTCIELSEIDQDSYAFRYPMNRKGDYSTPKHLMLNLSSFAEHMSKLLEELDTVRFGLSGEIDLTEDAVYIAIQGTLQ